MNNYKPTKKEVLKEMWDGIRKSFNDVKNISKESVIGAFTRNTFLYIIPSALKSDTYMFKDSFPVKIGGGMLGMIGIAGQMTVYNEVYKKGYPEALLIPVATNVASGIYELTRYSYNKAKKQLIKNHNQSLETKVLDSSEKQTGGAPGN